MMRLTFATLAAVLALFAVGCKKDPTDVTGDAIRAHRTIWQNQMLTTYHFDYVLTGSLISWAGKVVRVDVQGNTVQSATVIETSESLPASSFPTIDALFDRAEAAAQVHNLHLITFDDAWGYPTYVSIGGAADATEAITITNLAP